MSDPAHHKFWPPGVPHTLEVGDEIIWDRFAARAAAMPDEPGLHFLGRAYSWRELIDSASGWPARCSRCACCPATACCCCRKTARSS